MLRTITKPYYVAVAETTGDYVYKLIPAVAEAMARDNLSLADRQLKQFDTVLDTFARNNDRATLRIAIEHWAHRLAPPASVRAAATMFGDIDIFQALFLYLRRLHPQAGNGLAVFQQALKDCGLISIKTLVEEADEMRRAL